MRRYPAIQTILAAACALTASMAVAMPTPAEAAEFSFSVSYRAYLSGIRVGNARLTGKLDGFVYQYSAEGEVSGIARLFGSYRGSSEGQGNLANGKTTFRAATHGDGEQESIRLRLQDGRVRKVELKPAPQPHRVNHPKRVQLTEAHKRNVVDPMRALVATDGFDGREFDSSLCKRVLPVFAGESRFDIALSFREIREVSSSRSNGYSGPAMVCEASFRPVAGHRTDHSTTRYLRDEAEIEVILAPMPNSGILVPFRVTVSTPLGPAVLQSQTFVSSGRYAAYAGEAE